MGNQKTHTFSLSCGKSDVSVVFLRVIKYSLHLHKHVLQECWLEQLIYLHVIWVLGEYFSSDWEELWKAGKIDIKNLHSFHFPLMLVPFLLITPTFAETKRAFWALERKRYLTVFWEIALSLAFVTIVLEPCEKKVLAFSQS